MIDLRDEQARKFWCDPLLVKLVFLFLLDAVVAGDVEALAEVGLEIWIGRLGAEAFEVVIEVIFENGEREVRVGMLVETFGDEDVGAEKHRAAPEFSEERALDAHVADVLGVFGRRDSGDFLVEGDCDGLSVCVPACADRDFYGLAVEIGGRNVPVLAFALVHVELDGVAVGAMEGFVTIEDDLHVVFAGFDVVEVADGIAEGGVVDGGGLAGLKIRRCRVPKIIWVRGASEICMRGSSLGSLERMRRRRPSSGWALRSLGKETENLGAVESGAALAGAVIKTLRSVNSEIAARRAEVHNRVREREIISSVLRVSGLDAMGDRGSRKAGREYCVLRRGGRRRASQEKLIWKCGWLG